MNEYAALVAWCYPTAGKQKAEYSDRSLSQRDIVHRESHVNWPDSEADPPRWEAGDPAPQPCDSLPKVQSGRNEGKAAPAHTQ